MPRLGRRLSPSGRACQPIDLDLIRVTHSLREIKGRLQTEPRFRAAPERLVEPDRHLRRDA
jgi:hypothetical protein